MKTLILFILLILSTIANADIALYTLDSDQPRDVEDMYQILEGFHRDSPEKNILFYVHGRKKHLEDELAKLPKIESKYNVKVVMLHWDSYKTLITRPTDNAKKASFVLLKAFNEIKRFEEDYKDELENKSINLLCHSMGNLILKHAVESMLEDKYQQTKLFDNFVSIGADVPMNDHYKWLQKFDLARQSYIMMNNRDIVLLLSYLLDLKDRRPMTYKLGLGFDNFPSKKQDIKSMVVPHVKYVDLSDVLISDHGYYVSKDKIMLNIFNKLLNGKDFVSPNKKDDNFRVKTDKEKDNIFYIKR